MDDNAIRIRVLISGGTYYGGRLYEIGEDALIDEMEGHRVCEDVCDRIRNELLASLDRLCYGSGISSK